MISILTPTCKRPGNVNRLISSIKDTASGKNRIELLFYVDDNDVGTRDCFNDFYEIVKDINFIELKFINDIGNDKQWYNRWWNYLWKNCSGDYIMQCGDDIVFRTKDWDLKVIEEFGKYPDKMVLLYCNDGSCDSKDRATHPFLTKEWCRELGYFIPGIFDGGFNDTWLTEIAKGANRFVYLENIITDHLHPDFNKSELDDVYLKQREMIREQGAPQLFLKTKEEREKGINRIINYIRRVGNED
jgi:hypothetical protein